MQRKPASRTGGITLRHRNDQVGSPWRNTTGGPLPSSTCARRSPSSLRYFGLNGKSGRPSKRSSGVRTVSGIAGEHISVARVTLVRVHVAVMQLAPILAAKSRTPFYIAGGLLVVLGGRALARAGAAQTGLPGRPLGAARGDRRDGGAGGAHDDDGRRHLRRPRVEPSRTPARAQPRPAAPPARAQPLPCSPGTGVVGLPPRAPAGPPPDSPTLIGPDKSPPLDQTPSAGEVLSPSRALKWRE